MQSFEVEILKPKAADILYDLEQLKLIKLKKKSIVAKKVKRTDTKNILSQIENGLKDVANIQSGKIKPKTLSQILNEK